MPTSTPDTFARIGLALERLLDQSTVHGPAKTEVQRLAQELQGLTDNVDDIALATIRPLLEGLEGRLTAYVDQQFNKLADTLEAGGTYRPDPVPPLLNPPGTDPLAPLPDPQPEAPSTGNIPFVPAEGPSVVFNDTLPGGSQEPVVGGQGNDAFSGTFEGPGDDILPDSLLGGQGNDTVDAGGLPDLPVTDPGSPIEEGNSETDASNLQVAQNDTLTDGQGADTL